jgi:hypothetical protein
MPNEFPAKPPRGDLLWICLCTSTEVAVSIILNRYSSTMPILLIAGICAIPILLLIAVVWRHEREHGWIKRKFSQHPISYSLLGVAFVPFFIYSTAILSVRLQETLVSARKIVTNTASSVVATPLATAQKSPAPQQPVSQASSQPRTATKNNATSSSKPLVVASKPVSAPVAPSQTITADHGIAIGGDAQVQNPTVNNFGPSARRIPESQKTELESCLSAHPGRVKIMVISGNSEAGTLAQDWFDVFHVAKWSIDDNRIGSFLVGGGPTPAGTQISFHGSINNDLTDLKYDHDSPGGSAADCFIGKPSPAFATAKLIPTPTMADEYVQIAVYPQP